MRFVGETRLLTTANAVQAMNVPPGAEVLEIRGTSTTTAFQFCPNLTAFYFDNSAGTYTDASGSWSDRGDGTTVTLSSFEASVDFIYLGCVVPFRGLYVNQTATNSTAAVLTIEYWNGAWTSAGAITDVTSNGGATLNRDGAITIDTVPTDWTTTRVSTGGELFWIRLSSSATWDSSVAVAEVILLPIQPCTGSTAFNLRVVTTTTSDAHRFQFDPQFVGGIEFTGSNLQTVRAEWFGRQSSAVAVV